MAAMSKLEIANILLLKFIESQGSSVRALDVAKISEEWPAGAGPAPSARTVSTRLAEIKKDAIAKGLVNKHFSIPCSNYSAAKAKGAGQRQRGAPRSKKRTREDEDEDEGMEMTDNESSRNKIVKSEVAATQNPNYPSPPSTSRVNKSHPNLLTRVTICSRAAAVPKGSHTAKQATSEAGVGDDDAVNSDSDSDSLADLEDTPSKARAEKKRKMPTRQSRVVKKYYAEDDDAVEAGGIEESEDDFDPFKLRREREKKEARMQHVHRLAHEYDSDE